jgi:hypothetical protein
VLDRHRVSEPTSSKVRQYRPSNPGGEANPVPALIRRHPHILRHDGLERSLARKALIAMLQRSQQQIERRWL